MDEKPYNFNKLTANIFFVFALFPFVSIYPIATDVQPTASFSALVIYFLRIVVLKKISSLFCITVLVFISALLFINPFESINLEIGKVIALFLGLVTALFIFQNKNLFSATVFSAVIKVYFLISMLFLAFPTLIVSFQSLIVRKMNVTEFGYRGISTLSTEPGLFGGLLVGFIAINLYFYRKEKLTRKSFRLNLLLLFIMIALTKSGSGYLYFFVFVIALVCSKISAKKMVLSSIFLVFTITVLLPQISKQEFNFEKLGRGTQTFVNLMSNPQLLIKDRSVVYRLYAVYVAIISFSDNPLGVGHGAVKETSQAIVDKTPTLSHFYGSYNEYFHPVSSFGFYLTAYGISFVLLVLLILVTLRPSAPYMVLALIFLLFSYSFAFPITWLLLVFGSKRKEVLLKR